MPEPSLENQDLRSESQFLMRAHTSLAAGVAALFLFVMSPHPALSESLGKIGLIGDSMMVATNTDQMCGAGRELPDCLESKFGKHDEKWGHGSARHSWSIARRLGYKPDQVINAANDGEQWKDAFDQAWRITEDPEIETVFINLGANDVCEKLGHDYVGDLEEIELHIDDTLEHLVTYLSPGSKIYWTGVLDIVGFRNVMAKRRHDYMFRSCQGLWDLDSDEITEEATHSICKDQGFDGRTCGGLADLSAARKRVLDVLFDYYLDRYGVDEGPCGRVLSSANDQQDRKEAKQFNKALNALLAQKAAEFDGRNGVDILFTNAPFEAPIEPNYVSRLDCFHPNRAGQMKLAQEIWNGFFPDQDNQFTFWFDEFDDLDWCTQEFAAPWDSCWYDYGGSGFVIEVDDEEWLKLKKNTSRKRKRQIVRRVGDLSDMTHAWMSFNHKRESLDDEGDRAYFKVYYKGRWREVDIFEGSGNDVGEHAGKYYNLTPYLSSDVRIMFQTGHQGSMKNGDRVKFDNINIFSWK